MKKIKIGLMLFLGVLASGSLMAMGTLRVDIIPGTRDKAQVDVLEAPDSQVKVELKDSNGNIIFADNEEPLTADYKKLYDFSKLSNGKYTFEVKQGDETEMDNVVVNNGNVQILGQEEQIAPDFKSDGKFLELTFPNTTHQSARLLLYRNASNKMVFQETLDPQYDIQQTLNLAGLKTGHYKAVLISDGSTYNYNFYIG